MCPSECWACVFLVLFLVAGILVIVGVSSHLRLIMRSYKDCSAEEERGTMWPRQPGLPLALVFGCLFCLHTVQTLNLQSTSMHASLLTYINTDYWLFEYFNYAFVK